MKKEPLYTGAFWGVLDKQKQVIACLEKDYRTDLDNFKKELQKGELLLTPFDQIKAFTTVLLGQWDDETTKPFRDLQEKVEENQGKEVLVIKSTTSEEGPLIEYCLESQGIMPPPKFYITKLDLKLGKISSPLESNIQTKEIGSVKVPTGEIVIPVLKTLSASLTCYDLGENPLFSKDLKWMVYEGPIKEELLDLPHLLSEKITNKFMSYLPSSYSLPEKQSKILFDKEVEEYFTKSLNGEEFYQKVQGTLKEHEQNKVTGL